jgi:iron complex outermembrane recepter protein
VSDADPTTPAFSDHIGSASYCDLGAAYHFTPKSALRIGINNLFDRNPPLLAGASNLGPGGASNTYPSTYDPFGRTIFAKILVGL